MAFAESASLHGQSVSLVPLAHAHHDDLVEAVKDGELWTLWYTTVPPPGRMRTEIDRRLGLQAQGSMVPFAVIDKATNEAVGMTTFMNIDAVNRRLEVGSTWYRKRVQRSPLNTECKLLLLTHAFERLNCIAVEFRTHFFNPPRYMKLLELVAVPPGVVTRSGPVVAPEGTLAWITVAELTV